MRPFSFQANATLRNNLRNFFQLLQQENQATKRRFLTLHDPRIAPRHSVNPQFRSRPNAASLARASLRTPKHKASQVRTNTNNARPSPDTTAHLGSPAASEADLSLSGRLRKLSREYGWSAVGVYFLLSALDFPFCFAAVRLLGTERIGHWEHVVVGAAWKVISLDWLPGRGGTAQAASAGGEAISEDALSKLGKQVEGDASVTALAIQGGQAIDPDKEGQGWNWGVEEAEKEASKSDATIWTQLALAYAIHKSFIFLRVPATVAVTPKVVKVLRSWGWNIGKRRPKTIKGGVKKDP